MKAQPDLDPVMELFEPELDAMDRYRFGLSLRAVFRDPSDSDAWIEAERDQRMLEAWEKEVSRRYAASWKEVSGDT